MIYKIKNEYLSAEINSKGAEIHSIKTNDGCEYMWQGDEKYWSGQAPIMFPICGRLFGGKYTYLGKEYTMPSHGIARGSEFALKSQEDNTLTLSLVANEESKKQYPFDFIFDVTFSLVGSSLRIEHKVTNTDKKVLIFGIGGHPAFNVPLEKGLCFEDYKVELGKKCDAFRVEFSPTCFLTENDKLYTQGGTKTINLRHDLFDDDAIFLYNIPKEIKLYSDKGEKSVTIKFDNMKYIGLWHAVKKDAPYLCIEPWTSQPSVDGIVDDLNTIKEKIHLDSGCTFKNRYEIVIK